jgi:methyltransferase OMS1
VSHADFQYVSWPLNRLPKEAPPCVTQQTALLLLHPLQALQQAAVLLRPGGRLYLLEHGRSSSWFGWVAGWLNDYMDKRAPAHHAKWGCWYNRDIMDIVQQVRGL